jgi:hypothetical protein
MPVDIRFSKSAFVEEYNRDPFSTRLSDALEAAVQRELHQVLLPKVLEIVARLNAMGHQLGEYLPPVAGEIAFRDDIGKDGNYRCFLRLSVDTIVSVGFCGTPRTSNDDAEDINSVEDG